MMDWLNPNNAHTTAADSTSFTLERLKEALDLIKDISGVTNNSAPTIRESNYIPVPEYFVRPGFWWMDEETRIRGNAERGRLLGWEPDFYHLKEFGTIITSPEAQLLLRNQL